MAIGRLVAADLVLGGSCAQCIKQSRFRKHDFGLSILNFEPGDVALGVFILAIDGDCALKLSHLPGCERDGELERAVGTEGESVLVLEVAGTLVFVTCGSGEIAL